MFLLQGMLFSTLLLPLSAQKTSQDFNLLVQEKGNAIEEGFVKKPVKIAFATPLMQISDYWRRSIDSFKGRMDEIGIKYEISEFSTKVDENRKLRECIRLALNTNPDYLVLTPNDKDDEAIISRLLAQKKVKVIMQNVTSVNEKWEENQPLIYIGFDQKMGTVKLADRYMEIFGRKESVKYAILYHIPGNQVSRLRGDYFNEIINENFQLVREFYTDGNRENSRKAALQIIDKHPDIDFIYACSTDIAFGIIDALKEKGIIDKVVVNGWGGGASELKSILNKDLNFTVMRMNDDNGVAMAEAVRMDLYSKSIPMVYSGEMIVVGEETDRAVIDNLKMRAFRYSDKQINKK